MSEVIPYRVKSEESKEKPQTFQLRPSCSVRDLFFFFFLFCFWLEWVSLSLQGLHALSICMKVSVWRDWKFLSSSTFSQRFFFFENLVLLRLCGKRLSFCVCDSGMNSKRLENLMSNLSSLGSGRSFPVRWVAAWKRLFSLLLLLPWSPYDTSSRVAFLQFINLTFPVPLFASSFFFLTSLSGLVSVVMICSLLSPLIPLILAFFVKKTRRLWCWNMLYFLSLAEHTQVFSV